MNKLSRHWLRYVSLQTNANNKATALMRKYMEKYGTDDMQRIVDYAHALVDKYGEASAAIACELHDAVAKSQNVTVPPAKPAPVADIEEVAKAIYGVSKQSKDQIPNVVGRLVKQVGADTTLQNALRDGAYYAWIPNGDTCAFCLTLASKGWQRATKKLVKGGHADHIHANCDCEFAISFKTNGTVQGYEPDEYRSMYDNAEGKSPKEKINSMRREHREQNKDKINEQKRILYAENR